MLDFFDNSDKYYDEFDGFDAADIEEQHNILGYVLMEDFVPETDHDLPSDIEARWSRTESDYELYLELTRVSVTFIRD